MGHGWLQQKNTSEQEEQDELMEVETEVWGDRERRKMRKVERGKER